MAVQFVLSIIFNKFLPSYIMSVSNLFIPNDYTLYCNDLNANNLSLVTISSKSITLTNNTNQIFTPGDPNYSFTIPNIGQNSTFVLVDGSQTLNSKIISGGLLTGSSLINITQSLSSTQDYISQATGDTNPRFIKNVGGNLYFGPGNTSVDTLLHRTDVSKLSIGSGSGGFATLLVDSIGSNLGTILNLGVTDSTQIIVGTPGLTFQNATSGYNATALKYCEDPAPSNVTINWTGAATVSSTMNFSRIGNIVFATFNSFLVTPTASGVFSAGGSQIPTRFLPTLTNYFPLVVYNNGLTSLGQLQITNTGAMTASPGLTSTTFTTGAGAAGITQTVITWTTN